MAAFDIYIDFDNGNDSTGLGTVAQPWKTLDKALDEAETLAASDTGTVHMAAGTYEEANRVIAGKNIFGIHWVMVNRVTVQPNDGVAVTSVIITTTNSYVTYNTVLGCSGLGSTSNITFKDITFGAETGSKFAFVLTSGVFTATPCTISGIYFHGCRFVAGDGVASVSACYAAHHAVVTSLTDIEFKNCTFTVDDASNGGTVLRLNSVTDLNTASDIRIINCTVDCKSRANVIGAILDVPVTSGFKVDRLSVINGASQGCWIGSQRATGHAGNTLVGTVDRVSVTTTGDHGLAFGALSTSTVLTARRCYAQAAGHAFIMKGTRKVVFENSVIVGLTYSGNGAVFFKGATDCTFQNNFVSAENARIIMNYDGTAGFNTSNCTIKNNIFRIDTANAAYMFRWYSDKDAGGNTFDNNVYDVIQSSNANPMGVVMLAAAAAPDLVTLADLIAAWTTGSYPNNDANSVVAEADVGADYIPAAGGNCDIGRGDPTVQPSLGGADYYDRPRLSSSEVAIGAVHPQRRSVRNNLVPLVQAGVEIGGLV